MLVLLGVMLPATQVQSEIISRTITVNGDMSDWHGPPAADITINPGQFSEDEDGNLNTGSIADLDYIVQGTGRDLHKFSYTYDATNLYMWVSRYASTNNITDWWFYIDTNNNGFMESTGGHVDRLLRVSWSGSTGTTVVRLYNYVEATAGGDSLICEPDGDNSFEDLWCPVVGIADGYDMPGTSGVEIPLTGTDTKNQSGGSTSLPSKGVEMETRISWAALGFTGPMSVGFHIASSNGSLIPNQINDNMNGIGGGIGSIAFSDLAVTKTASVTNVNAGSSYSYTVTVTNNGGSDATNISIEDILSADVTYISHTTSAGTYDSGTGAWNMASLANLATATLDITVSANLLATGTVINNTVNILALDQADPDTLNNQASVDVTVQNVPDILVLKSAQTIEDPVNGGTNPKSIPGAIVRYTITITNQGAGVADTDTVVITDAIPSNTELFVGDLDTGLPTGPGTPVLFIDGATSSGLSLSFTSLGSATDDIEFSDDGGASYTYIPGPDIDGYDASVTDFRLLTQGSFAASDGVNPAPSFTIFFKVRLQ